MRTRTHLASLAAPLVALLTVVACLPATNPWDPNTDPALQVPGSVRGTVAYPDRASAGGIAIELAPLPALPPIASTTTNDATDGAFAITAQPGTYWVRAVATGYQTLLIGPVTLRAGERVDIGRHTLDFEPATAAIGGRVSTGDTLSARGVKVTASPLVAGGGCGAPLGEAVTDEDGDFLIEALRPGTYVVVAFVEGATVALSAPITLVSHMTGNVDLAISEGSDALTIVDPLTGNDVFTREGTVRVIVDDAFSWATEMNVSDDPTFARGTGWKTFTTDSLFTLSSDLVGLGRTVVYAKFRSPCATSPLYSDDIVFDDAAPVLLSARLEGQDGLSYADGLGGPETLAPLVVVRDSRQTLLLAIDAFDITGVHIDVVALGDDGSETPVAFFDDTESTDSLALVRHQVPIPVDEGLSALRVDVRDLAGNVKVFTRTLSFRVLRDLKPPTPPLPAVTTMTVSSDTALVWLTERDCELDDGTTTIALVCEENPRETGFFEVRGGPALVDFTPFDDPPFVVPVHRDGETDIEIRAVDLAGNPSSSVGNVTITHVSRRTLLTLPPDRAFSTTAGETKLAALGPTALYEVEQRRGFTTGTVFPVVVAHPADRQEPSLDPFTSTTPEMLRRISWGCAATPGGCNIPSEREVGPFAGGMGALHWLEFSGAVSPGYEQERRARLMRSVPDGDGRHPILSIPSTSPTVIVDSEGRPAQVTETCATRGRVDCALVDAWSGFTQAPPTDLVVDGRDVLVSGIGTKAISIGQSDAAIETEVVVGPALIGMLVSPRATSRLVGIEMHVDVEPGVVLESAAFRRFTNNTSFTAYPDTPSVDAARLGIVTRGTGVETVVVKDDLQTTTNSTFEMLVGLLVPSGVTLTLAKRPAPVDDLVYDIDDPYKVTGLVVHPLTDERPDSITAAAVTGSLRVDEHLVGALLIPDNDFLGAGTIAGVTRVTLASDGALQDVTAQASALDVDDPTRHRGLVRTPRAESQIHIADAAQAAPELPTTCVTLLEVEDDVTLRDLSLDGRGMLDDLYVHAFKSTTGSTGGVYAADPIFAGVSYVPLESPDEEPCYDRVLVELSSETLSGSVSDDVLDVATASGSGAPVTWTGVAPANAVGPSTILPMTPDIGAWEVYLGPNPIDDPGDADLFGRYGADPTTALYDLYSFEWGSDEYFYGENTGAGDLHVAVLGWEGVAGYRADAVPLVRTMTVDVPAGSSLQVNMTGTGDADVYVAFGEEPTFFTYDCASYLIGTSDEGCTATTTLAATAYVSVAYYDTSVVDLEALTLASVEPRVIATVPLGDANSYRVTIADSNTAQLYIGLDQDPLLSSYECRTWSGLDQDCEPYSAADIPVTADNLHIAVVPVAEDASYVITVELFEVGCESVRAYRDTLGSYAEGTFTKGVYALTLGRTFTPGGAATWPVSAPKVKRGPRIEGNGAVRVLGGATEAIVDQGALLVAGVSSSQAICDVTLTFDAATRYTRVLPSSDETFAIAENTTVTGASTARIVKDDGTSAAPGAELSTLVDFGDARTPLEIARVGADLAWLEVSASGFAPRVAARSVDDDDTSEPCTALVLSDEVAPLEVTTSSRHEHTFVVGGLSPTGGVVHRIAVSPRADDADCVGAAVVESFSVEGRPLAATSDGRDTFVVVEDAAAGTRLVHIDGRDVKPLFAGGASQVVGYDVVGDDVAMTLAPTYGEGPSVFVLLTDGGLSGGVVAIEIARAQSMLQPELVDAGLVALTRDDAGALVVRAFPRRQHEGVVVETASATLAAAPATPANDPLLLARSPILAAHGTTLAVLGYETGGRTLSLYEVSIVDDGDTVSASATAVFGPLSVPSLPVSLAVDEGVALVTWADGSSVVVSRSSLGAWALDEDAHGPGERVVAISSGALLVLRDPGSVFVQKPPTVLEAELRSPSTNVPLRFAAGAYLHELKGGGTLADGDLVLFDATASPPLLWRIDRASGAFVPADGPHRPLLVGTEGIGWSAMPKVAGDSVYSVRRTPTGNALFRMRL